MTVYKIHQTDDPSTLHLDFTFKAESVGCFEVPLEFYEEHLDAYPAPDPFEVLEALIDHFHAYGDIAGVHLAKGVQHLYQTRRTHIMAIYLYGELDKVTAKVAGLRKELKEHAAIEAGIRTELQGLPITEETAPAEAAS